MKLKKNFYKTGTLLAISTISPVVAAVATYIPQINSKYKKTFAVENFNHGIFAKEMAKNRTAWGWEVKDINDDYFDGIPESGNGKIVKIISVDNFPLEQKIEITIQFSNLMKDKISLITETKIFEVGGFRKESLNDRVDRLYGDLKILAKDEAKKISANSDNWTIDDINLDNFTELPVSKENITVSLQKISFDDSDIFQGKIILTYNFSWYNGAYSINRDYVVSGFEGKLYSSNEAAQNHYKLIALYKTLKLKQGAEEIISNVNTREFKKEGISAIKKYFDLPSDLNFNTVKLNKVINSEDNSYDSFLKNKNIKLNQVKFVFEIYDWVNYRTSIVETELFDKFSNPLQIWDKILIKNTLMAEGESTLNDTLFPAIKKFYWNNVRWWGNNNILVARVELTTLISHYNWSSNTEAYADWTGSYDDNVIYSVYGNVYGRDYFKLEKNMDHNRFINMLRYDSDQNLLRDGDLGSPIKQGGLSEVLRKSIVNSINKAGVNQDLFLFDYIKIKGINESNNKVKKELNTLHPDYASAAKENNNNAMWIGTTVDFDVTLDWESISISTNVWLGMMIKFETSNS